MMSSVVNPLVISGIEPRRTGNRGFSLAPTADTFETADNAVTIGTAQQYQYERLCAAIGRPDLLTDPRFADPDSRMAHDRKLQEELTKTFKTKTALEREPSLRRQACPPAR